MADDAPVLSQAEYDALLARSPWIALRDPYASLDRGWESLFV